MTKRGQARVPAQWLERLAAASLGCATGFAIFETVPLAVTTAFAAAVFGGLAVLSITFKVLERLAAPLPVGPLQPSAGAGPALGAGGLFLRLQDVLAEASAAERSGDELLLDDPLKLPAGSRVVQLFQRPTMPTAGELQARIDRHLERDGGSRRTDDSGELFDALASLKRSLR